MNIACFLRDLPTWAKYAHKPQLYLLTKPNQIYVAKRSGPTNIHQSPHCVVIPRTDILYLASKGREYTVRAEIPPVDSALKVALSMNSTVNEHYYSF